MELVLAANRELAERETTGKDVVREQITVSAGSGNCFGIFRRTVAFFFVKAAGTPST